MEGKHHSSDYFDQTFDVVGYLEDVWGPEALKVNPLTKDILDEVHAILQKLDLPEGCKQLEFGCGPSIHMVLSSSRVASHIVMTEYSGQNRQRVVDFLKGQDFGFTWNHLFEYIGQKEGKPPADIEKRTRAAIKEVLPCDTEKAAIFGVAQLPQFDLMTSCLCLEAACKDLAAYNKAMADLACYVKPGGYLVLSGVLDQSKYTVRNKLFFSLPHSRSDIDGALTAAGYENIEWYAHSIEVKYECEYDASGYFTLVAQKKK